MTSVVELYWSFRSPYSYIILPRIARLEAERRARIDLKVVHPAAIRNPSYFAAMNKLARPYFMMDSARMAAFHGMPFRRPVPDPIKQDPATLTIAPEQPLAVRLGRLGIAATKRGRGLAFCREVSNLLWSGEVDNWHEGVHLSDAAARAGLNLQEMETHIADDPASYDKSLAANDASLRAAGHWGVPTMVFKGEPFFGQDRFEVLLWRLEQEEGNAAVEEVHH
ncbi:MAG: 2-hydroxychromene-2-carboxylate isomerase [Bradyrhizobiaceae bacterium]|nr:MAG: 2-hydroxychromene-2-carboxylate isomerase [Bradyrhizobiaceae bacterium]